MTINYAAVSPGRLVNKGLAAFVVNLDISLAFDCISHAILLDSLHSDFGLIGNALA